MKIHHIILLILLVLVVLAGVGVQTFLSQGLTSALNQTVFPEVRSRYGLDLTIETATVQLLKGRAEVTGLTLRNLKDYEKPMLLTAETLFLQIEWRSLFTRDPIVIKRAEALGVILNIERNAKQNINLKELIDKIQSAEPLDEQALKEMAKDLAPEERIPVVAAGAASQFPIRIRRMVVEGTALYADAALKHEYPLALRLSASDLFTVPAEDQSDSLIVLRGSHADDPESFIIDLNAIVEPLVDLNAPSFNASGSILNIHTDLLGDLLAKNDLESDAFSIKPSIASRKGFIKGSQVDLILRNLKYRGVALGETSLNLPLGGTLQEPTVDLTAALQSLFEKSSLNFLKALGMREVPSSPASGTNTTATPSTTTKTLGDVLVEQLGKHAKEVEQNKDLKDSLKTLSDSLFRN